MTLVIGLAGKAEHGKTAAARIICEWVTNNGGTAGIFEISKLIYNHAVELGLLPPGLERDKMTNEQVKVLVDEGSRMRNTVDPNYWTDRVIPWALESNVDVAIIPNLRFPQEAEAVRRTKGYVWRVNRLNPAGSPFVSTTRDPNHETETALDRWPADFYIYNVTGHGALLEELVVTLYEYVVDLDNGQ